MAIDLKQLRALIAISETGSVTRAAELLHLVQPAVSRQLRLLEEEIGTPLFDRERSGMELTEAGRVFTEYARRALRELDDGKAEIQPTGGIVSGIVNIGLLPSTCDLIAGPLAAGVKARYPGVRMRVSTGYVGHLQQWLERGELDIAMLYNLQPTAPMEIRPLLDESLYIVGLPGAALAMSQPAPLSFLRDQPVILPSAPHGLRSLVEHACAIEGIVLDIVAEADAMNLQKTFVQHGLGYTVLPGAAILDDVARGALAAAPISDPPLRRRVVVALPSQRRSSKATRCVLEELTNQVVQCVESGRWPGAELVAGQRTQ
jgi:LysR family nitrogen assimilation transcriptional regulator